MKLKEIIPLWMEEKRRQVKLSSLSSYRLLVERHIIPYFGDHENILEQEVQKWVYDKIDGKEIGVKTMGDILICLKMILKFGAKRELITYNGFDIHFPTSTQKNNKLEVLSKDSYKTLTNYLSANFTFKNMGILMALYTGMRIGEICCLKWNDVDLENKVFIVRKTIQRVYIEEGGRRFTKLITDSPKTKNSEREIPISKSLLALLKPIKKVVNDEYYILSNNQKPIEPRVFRNYYVDVLMKLHLPYLKFHGLRHTFATFCIEGGADVKTTSVLLGHSNVSITLNTYCHPDLNKKRSVIDKIFK